LRRLVEYAAYRHCRFPGCDQPVAACQPHHITPRAQGGPGMFGEYRQRSVPQVSQFGVEGAVRVSRDMTHGTTRSAALMGRVLPTMTNSFDITALHWAALLGAVRARG
jgi:hypothetical protein